jgi:hypothetical protein
MSEHYVKVDDVEVVESSNSTALIVFVVAIIAIAVIAMVMWQPWATPQPQSNSTTIIRETQSKAPDNRPIIVNPPAVQGDTKIDIHNEVPPAKDPPVKTDANADSGAANNMAANNEPN